MYNIGFIPLIDRFVSFNCQAVHITLAHTRLVMTAGATPFAVQAGAMEANQERRKCVEAMVTHTLASAS